MIQNSALLVIFARNRLTYERSGTAHFRGNNTRQYAESNHALKIANSEIEDLKVNLKQAEMKLAQTVQEKHEIEAQRDSQHR